MQWFKHDSNSTMDYKIKKLIIKYGAVGYAIYFHCLELIAGGINENNITFELEHDSEIIADDLRISSSPEKSGKELVEEIMRYMVSLNLFEENNGHIFCFKLLKRLDASMTSNTKLRALISKAKKQEVFLGFEENHDTVMTNSDFIMQEEKRKEEKRLEQIQQEKTDKKYKYICPESIELCELLVNYCKRDNANFSKTANQINKWTNSIGEIHFLDGYSWEDIKKVIDFAKNDSFWNSNILSGDKLRKQMEQLYVKSQKNCQNSNQQGIKDKFTGEEYRKWSDDPDKVAY